MGLTPLIFQKAGTILHIIHQHDSYTPDHMEVISHIVYGPYWDSLASVSAEVANASYCFVEGQYDFPPTGTYRAKGDHWKCKLDDYGQIMAISITNINDAISYVNPYE